MKKFIAILGLFALVAALSTAPTMEAKAQLPSTEGVTISKDSAVGTDTVTVTFTSVVKETVLFTLNAVRDTGTLAGKVVLSGYNNKVWKPIDSTTYSNASLVSNVLSISFPAKHSNSDLLYSKYKLVLYESVTGKVKTIKGEMLRRNK